MKRNMRSDIEGERHMAWKVLKIIGMVILGIAVAILFGFVVMWLWNWLMPMIFGLTTITYWQAVGIFILAKIIFGGIGGGGSDDSSKKSKHGIKHEIGKEIGKEIKKEFNKEFDKGYKKSYKESSDEECSDEECSDEECSDEEVDYDQMYEKWWDSKGEKDFKEYMNDSKET